MEEAKPLLNFQERIWEAEEVIQPLELYEELFQKISVAPATFSANGEKVRLKIQIVHTLWDCDNLRDLYESVDEIDFLEFLQDKFWESDYPLVEKVEITTTNIGLFIVVRFKESFAKTRSNTPALVL